MKHCHYCGKEIHEQSSFCPYCMKSQIDKRSTVIHEKKSGKWLYILIITIMMLVVVAVLSIFLNNDTNQAETTTSTTETTAATTQTEATITTETHTITTETITTTVPPETTSPQETQFQLGDYITEGKTLSQIQGYGSYEDMGGIVLTIEEITDNTLTFSIVLYDESGLASDTVSARNITAEIIENTAEFKFRDMLDGRGTGRLTLENGMIHIETWGDTNRPTSIIVNEYLN